MKQAIEEKIIIDVMEYYTPYQNYYHQINTVNEISLMWILGMDTLIWILRHSDLLQKNPSIAKVFREIGIIEMLEDWFIF